jgi:hypothetical protein
VGHRINASRGLFPLNDQVRISNRRAVASGSGHGPGPGSNPGLGCFCDALKHLFQLDRAGEVGICLLPQPSPLICIRRCFGLGQEGPDADGVED